jgi:hypothetical protein
MVAGITGLDLICTVAASRLTYPTPPAGNLFDPAGVSVMSVRRPFAPR